MTKVNYDHLHGKRVRITHGYQADKTGIVIRTTYQCLGSVARWIAKIKLDEKPTGILGTDPDGHAVVDVSYVEVLS